MPGVNTSDQPMRWLFAELVVVVLGILIAFQVDNWNNLRIERSSERTALEQIILDIESDIERNSEALSQWQGQLNGVIRLRSSLSGPEPRSREAIGAAYRSAYFSPRWQITANTFQSLRENGQLHIISDADLQKALLAYYDDNEPYLADIARSLLDVRNEFAEEAMPDMYLDMVFRDNDIDDRQLVARIDGPLDQIPTSPRFMARLAQFAFVLRLNINTVSQQTEEAKKLVDSVNQHLRQL